MNVSLSTAAPTHVVGDLHGHLEATRRLLEGAGLLREGSWCGEGARLLFLGDFFNRGPDGLACVELVMRLQREAEAAGGWTEALVGNHDMLTLAARYFGEQASGRPETTFIGDWRASGGVEADLAGLSAEHTSWLSSRPALLRLGETLYMHADAVFYETLGSSPEAVNRAFRTVLQGRDRTAWERLLEAFSEHKAFFRRGGKAKAKRLLKRFGGVRLVHAHTPISDRATRRFRDGTAPVRGRPLHRHRPRALPGRAGVCLPALSRFFARVCSRYTLGGHTSSGLS